MHNKPTIIALVAMSFLFCSKGHADFDEKLLKVPLMELPGVNGRVHVVTSFDFWYLQKTALGRIKIAPLENTQAQRSFLSDRIIYTLPQRETGAPVPHKLNVRFLLHPNPKVNIWGKAKSDMQSETQAIREALEGVRLYQETNDLRFLNNTILAADPSFYEFAQYLDSFTRRQGLSYMKFLDANLTFVAVALSRMQNSKFNSADYLDAKLALLLWLNSQPNGIGKLDQEMHLAMHVVLTALVNDIERAGPHDPSGAYRVMMVQYLEDFETEKLGTDPETVKGRDLFRLRDLVTILKGLKKDPSIKTNPEYDKQVTAVLQDLFADHSIWDNAEATTIGVCRRVLFDLNNQMTILKKSLRTQPRTTYRAAYSKIGKVKDWFGGSKERVTSGLKQHPIADSIEH